MNTRKLNILLSILCGVVAVGCESNLTLSRSTIDRSSSYVSPNNLERTTINPADRQHYNVATETNRSPISASKPRTESQSDYISGHVATVFDYNIDGMEYSGEAFSDDEMLAMYARLVEYAHTGHSVCIGHSVSVSEREAVASLSTANEDEVVEWATKMVKKGYSVVVEWDAKARLYRCTAYRKTK